MSANTWILVANSANARMYSAYKSKLFMTNVSENDIHLIDQLANPTSRLHDKDLMSDNLGRYRSTEYGSDTFEPSTDPKFIEEDRFAMHLIDTLNDALNKNKFEGLILVAPPVFMGMLNKHISKSNNLKKTVVFTIEKNYIQLNERELVKHLSSDLSDQTK